MEAKNVIRTGNKAVFIMFLFMLFYCSYENKNSGGQLCDLGTGLKSRSVSFENPTGEPGKGGQAACFVK